MYSLPWKPRYNVTTTSINVTPLAMLCILMFNLTEIFYNVFEFKLKAWNTLSTTVLNRHLFSLLSNTERRSWSWWNLNRKHKTRRIAAKHFVGHVNDSVISQPRIYLRSFLLKARVLIFIRRGNDIYKGD